MTSGEKHIGEWHLNNRQGVGKVLYTSGGSYWGELKDGKEEGYGTWESANGDRYIG